MKRHLKKLVVYEAAFVLFTVGLALEVEGAERKAEALVKRELVWSAPGQEILAPLFSWDGDLLTLVTRGYIPDGADAEGLPHSFFKALEAKEKINPRFADPVIKVINLKGGVICEVKYGWNPALARDNRRVAFSEQVKPITGFRALASPMDGNGIQMYDCESGQTVAVAQPPHTAYLDRPLFSPDGGSIIYTVNEAVNGAYGGAVAIARVDLQQKQEMTLVNRMTVAAVPCPSPESKEKRPFMCQNNNLPDSFPQIVYDVSLVGNEIVALLGRPIPVPGDIYMASSYEMSLVTAFPEQKLISSLGRRKASSQDEAAFQAVSGERVLIFSQYWKLWSVTTGKQLPDLGPKNTDPQSIYSPDLKYYLRTESDHIGVYRTADGRQLQILPKMVLVSGAVWNQESNRFAIAGVPLAGASAVRHAEELVIYSVN
jgi:hypothetical protein